MEAKVKRLVAEVKSNSLSSLRLSDGLESIACAADGKDDNAAGTHCVLNRDDGTGDYRSRMLHGSHATESMTKHERTRPGSQQRRETSASFTCVRSSHGPSVRGRTPCSGASSSTLSQICVLPCQIAWPSSDRPMPRDWESGLTATAEKRNALQVGHQVAGSHSD